MFLNLSKHSIRRNFLIQLLLSLASMIFLFSLFLYFYIEESIYEDKRLELLQYAKNISNNRSLLDKENYAITENFISLNIEVVHLKSNSIDIDVYVTTKNKHSYLTLFYPFNLDDLSYLKVTKEISPTVRLLDKILHYIFMINIAGFALVIIYAIALSKMLVAPLKTLSARLSNMNEHIIKPIKIEELPQEFESLGITINHLIGRIQNFVKYQKELFIGTAHELKTPLAVIKLKNQVTLIKKRSPEEYIEALNITTQTVDNMNVIVSSILNIGRQEGAQLDKPIQVDVIKILQQKADDFKLLAENDKKSLEIDFQPTGFMATLQVTLLNQIIQNFLQNALKFTPKDKKIILKSSQDNVGLLIEVIDEGCGINDSVDLFAPFKREGNQQGVGLGLFLAKSASDALGAKISLENRKDGVTGTVASLQLNSKLSCILPPR